LPAVQEIFSNFKEIKIGKYFKFGSLIAIDKNIGRLLALLPVLLLGYLASPAEVGYFKIALGYIAAPSMVLGSISRLLTVQLPKSKSYGSDILKKHFFKTTLYSGAIATLMIIPFIVLAPFLINLFYGGEYSPSVNLVYYLAIMTILSGLGVGISAFYRTINRMKTSIAIISAQAIFFVFLVFFSVKIFTPLTAISLSLALSALFATTLQFLVIRNIFKNHEKD